MEDTVTITKQDYFQLRLDQATLWKLESGGVDNWSGYDDALYPWYNGEDIAEVEARLRKEIFG